MYFYYSFVLAMCSSSFLSSKVYGYGLFTFVMIKWCNLTSFSFSLYNDKNFYKNLSDRKFYGVCIKGIRFHFHIHSHSRKIDRQTHRKSSQWNKLNPHAQFLCMPKVCKWCLLCIRSHKQCVKHVHTHTFIHTRHTHTHVNILRRNKCEKVSRNLEFKDHWPIYIYICGLFDL